MEHTITVVGIGPGSKEYLLPIAQQAIDAAKLLIGSERALSTLAPAGIPTKIIDREIGALLDYMEQALLGTPLTVLVSGDPGFYSLLSALKTRFSSRRLTVIPGISSMQLAFARAGELWQDAVLVSMHGRSASPGQFGFAPGKKLGILTDMEHNPAYIAKLLIQAGWPLASYVWLGQRLSYETEEFIETTLCAAQEVAGFAHSVMVVKA